MGKIVRNALIFAAAAVAVYATGGIGAGFFGGLTATTGSLAASIGIGLTATAAAAIGGAAFGALLTVGLSIVQPSYSDVSEQSGIKSPIQNSQDTRKILYGTRIIGGTEIFIDAYDANGGDDTPNDTLVFARAVCDRPVNGFGTFYLGDKAVTFDGSGNANGAYRDKLFLKTYDGSQTTVDPWIKAADASWPDTAIGSGVAYYVVKAVFDPEVFPYGIGELRGCSIEVNGVSVYDPRLDSTRTEVGGSGTHRIDDPTTWEFSTNPALCIYDQMRDDTCQVNAIPDDEISVASIVTAANICDEDVAVKAGGTIKRYTCNGVVDGGRDKLSTIDLMLSAMGGGRYYEAGEFHIFAAAPVIASETIDEDYINAASFVATPPLDKAVNEVRGTYIEPSERYEQQEFPAQVLSAVQGDEGVQVLNLNLPFTDDHRTAQRLAKIKLHEMRRPSLQLDTTPAGAIYRPNEAIAVSLDEFGLSAEAFRLNQQTIKGGKGKQVSTSLDFVKEEAATYAWDELTDELDREATLPVVQGTGFGSITPANVTVTPLTLTAPDGRQRSMLEVSWDAPSAVVVRTLVDYRLNGQTAWTPGAIALAGDNNATLDLLHNTAWDIRVRHVQAGGLMGTEVIASNQSTDTINGVDTGANMLRNPGLLRSFSPFTFGSTVSGATCDLSGDNFAILDDRYRAAGIYNTVAIKHDYSASGRSEFVQDDIPVVPGKRYEAFGFVGGHRARINIFIDEYDKDGVSLRSTAGNEFSNTNGPVYDELDDYTQIGVFVTAHADAAYIRVRFQLRSNVSSQSAWMFVTRPYVGQANEGQVAFSPWSPGAGGAVENMDALPTQSQAGSVVFDPSSPLTGNYNSGSPRIEVAALTVYRDQNDSVDYPATNITATAGQGYWVYLVDAEFSGRGGYSFVATQTRTDVQADALFLGYVLVPSSGTETNSGTAPSGGGGGWVYDPDNGGLGEIP